MPFVAASAAVLLLLPLSTDPVSIQSDRSRIQAPVVWQIDTVHSDISFRIRHLVSRVRGTFRAWSGAISGGPDQWSDGSVSVTIQAASIFTDNEKRDADLRSARFFNADSFPAITFRSTSVTQTGDALKIAGDLTIRGITRPVVLDGEFTGLTGAPGPKQRGGFTATTKIDRLDYGVSWNRAVEGGGSLLGDEVTIEINIEAVRQ